TFQILGTSESGPVSSEIKGYVNEDGVTPEITIKYQEVNSTANDPLITLNNSYQLGKDNLLVYKAGRLLTPDIDYFEQNENTIELTIADRSPLQYSTSIIPKRALKRENQQILFPIDTITFSTSVEESLIYV